jgi:hypothetical protein
VGDDASARYAGVLLGESLRLDAVLEVPELRLRKVWRAAAGDPEAGQPAIWTFIEFDVPAARVDALADALSRRLEVAGGWYCSFGSADEMVVVFADRVFRYPRGDAGVRREVERHARAVGVPESQLDWEDGP